MSDNLFVLLALNTNYVKWSSVKLTSAVTINPSPTVAALCSLTGNITVLGAFINHYNTVGANSLVTFGARWYSAFSIMAYNPTSSAITIPKDTYIFYAYITQ